MGNFYEMPDFAKRMFAQVDDKDEKDRKILGRVMEYPKLGSPQQKAVTKQYGFTSDVEYVAYTAKRACLPYGMTWDAVKKEYLPAYPSEEALKAEFDLVFNAVPEAPEWRDANFDFILNPGAGKKYPPLTKDSVINNLTPKQAEATIRPLIGGWDKNINTRMTPGNKPQAAGLRAEEMAKFGFSQGYAVEYLNQFVDDILTSAMVSEIVNASYDKIRRQGKISSRFFNVRGYYK